MEIIYKGKRPVAIPSVGSFKPNEPIKVSDELGNYLTSDVPGFEKVYERKKKPTITKEVKTDGI